MNEQQRNQCVRQSSDRSSEPIQMKERRLLREQKWARVDVARPWQAEAVALGRGARFFLAQAPGGSGKSKLQCFLGSMELEEQRGQKQLILVPQSHLQQGFSGSSGCLCWRLKPGDPVMYWRVGQNLCHDSAHKRGIRLKRFLLTGADELGIHPTAIATHQALVSVWKSLAPDERARAIRHTTFRIDEAHHVRGVFLEQQEDGDVLSTRLGEFCHYVINSCDETSRIHFTTATFFRGDRAAILSPAVKELFTQYFLPWDEYWPSLGIEEFTIDHVNYRDDPVELVVRMVRSEPSCRHLVIIPPLGQKSRDGATLDRLLDALRGVFREDEVLDLVTPATQSRNKRLLAQRSGSLRVVVACRLFNEGTDWVECDRLHNTDSCERSLTLAVQRFFRPLRKHHDKKCVRIYNYVPQFDPSLDAEQVRELISDRSNAILAAVVTDLEIAPVRVPAAGRDLTLQECYGQGLYQELLEDLGRAVMGGCSPDAIVSAVVEKFGIPEGLERTSLGEGLLRVVARMARPVRVTKDHLVVPGFDAAGVRQAFDIVEAKDGLVERYFGTRNIDQAAICRLLNVLENPLTLEQIHEGIRAYFERTGKRLNQFGGWVPELRIIAATLASRLWRWGTTLAREVTKVLGPVESGRDKPLTLEQVHAGIRAYYDRTGKRLNQHHGLVPEFGIHAVSLNGRLMRLGTTLTREVTNVLGAPDDGLADLLNRTRQATRQYWLERGVRLTSNYRETIEGCGLNGAVLNYRLKKLGTTLAEVAEQEINSLLREKLPLEKIREVVAAYVKARKKLSKHVELIPELGSISGRELDRFLRRYYQTTLPGLRIKIADELMLEAKYRRRMTPDLLLRVRTLREQGCSLRDIAARLGLSYSSVTWALKKSPTVPPACVG